MKLVRFALSGVVMVAAGCALAVEQDRTAEASPAPTITLGGSVSAKSASVPGAIYTWVDRSEVLVPRVLSGVTDEPGRGRVLVYGGWQENGGRFDTWEWDGAGWFRRWPLHDPGVRIGATLVYDELRQRAIMTGGASEFLPKFDFVGHNSTWEWNGTDWTELSTVHAPSATALSAGTWDPVAGRMLVYGGFPPPVAQADGSSVSAGSDGLWSFDGFDWQEIPKAGAWPAAAGFNSMAWDRQRNVAVLLVGHAKLVFAGGKIGFGSDENGEVYQSVGEIWEWNGATWTRTGEARAQGIVTIGGQVIWNAAEQRIQLVLDELVGSEVRQSLRNYDGASWPLVGLAPTSSIFRVLSNSVWSTANSRPLSFAGVEIAPGTGLTTKIALIEGLAGAEWKMFDPAVQMPPLGGASGITLADGHLFVFGGALGGGRSDASYVWDGGRWTRVVPNTPAPRARERAGFAPVASGGVLFGGVLDSDSLAGDTWVWNMDTRSWSEDSSAPQPSARADHAMVSLGDDVYLFGGNTSAGGGSPNAETWRYRLGQGWQQLSPASAPAARSRMCAATLADGRALIAGGTPQANLWTFDGSSWTELEDLGMGAREGCSLVQRRGPDQVVLVGGQNAIGTLDLWTLLPVAEPIRELASRGDRGEIPPRRHASVFANNPPGGAILFGGVRNDTYYTLGDTWQLRVLGQACTDPSSCEKGAFCTDGVCCDSGACGPCATCAGASPGTCAPKAAGPAPGCDGNYACNSDGQCRLSAGQICASDSACASRLCAGAGVDAGADASSSPGVCCGIDGCAVACVDDRTIRDGQGNLTDCAPYRCEAVACKDSCTNVTDCVGDAICSADGRCVPPGTGGNQEDTGCGCTVVGAPVRAPWFALGFGALVAAALVRARRRR